MAVLKLVEYPDIRLSKKSVSVPEITPEIKSLAADMIETMYATNGIGLAAPQIGHNINMTVVDVTWPDGEKSVRVLINPEIISESPETSSYQEGCLSVPQEYADVIRPNWVEVRYQNLEGEIVTEKVDGLLATCIQHEIDHLNGVLFIDHLSPLKKKLISSRMEKRRQKLAKEQKIGGQGSGFVSGRS